MSHQFHPSILREYDVRGIVGSTLTEKDAYALGRSYAALAVAEGVRGIAVGRDGRSHSPMLESALVQGLTEGDIDVIRIGMGPSPMLYFATHTLGVGGGIQVTGSHNPGDYNGFKLLLNGRSVFARSHCNSLRMPSGPSIAHGSEPRPPAFATAAAIAPA